MAKKTIRPISNKSNKNNLSKTTTPESSSSVRISFFERIQNIISSNWAFVCASIILLFVFGANYDEMFDKKLDMNGDNIIYYSLGKSLYEGNGYTNVMSLNESPHTHFPPGYPAFIAAGMNFTSDGDFVFFKKVNGFLLGLSLLLFLWIIKRITQNYLAVALTTVLLAAMHKELLRFATIIMSEMLFIFLTMIVILIAIRLYEKGSFKNYSWKTYVLLGIFLFSVAYIYFVRTMGLSMIFGLIVWLSVIIVWQLFLLYKAKKNNSFIAVQGYKQKIFYYSTLVILISVTMGFAKISWDIRNESLGLKESTYTSNFLKKDNGQTMSTMSDWVARVKSNCKRYFVQLIPDILFAKETAKEEEISYQAYLTGFFVLLIMALGFIRTGSGGFLLFSYLSLTFGVLLFYPEQYATTRYITTTIPIIFFFFLNGLFNGMTYLLSKINYAWIKNSSSLISSIALVIFVLFWLSPLHVNSQVGYRYYAKHSFKKAYPDQNALNYMEAVEWCKNNLPDSARVICRKPEIYYIYSGFKKSNNFPQYASVDSIYNYLLHQKATHIILDNWFKHAYLTLHPAMKSYPEKFKVLQKIGELDSVKMINPAYVVEFNPSWGYFGDIVDGKREGKGYENRQDGVRFEGEYHNDLPNGYGVYFNPNNDVSLKGIWKDGLLIDGEGVELYGSMRYEGKIKNRLPNGYGICYDSTGKVIGKGIWSKGVLVKPDKKQ